MVPRLEKAVSELGLTFFNTQRYTKSVSKSYYTCTVLNLRKLKKIIATEPQPHRTVLKCSAILKNVAQCFEPGETSSNWASHQALNYVQCL